ncbi:7208_t:CDS:2, partial [Funneliformis geosporum]
TGIPENFASNIGSESTKYNIPSINSIIGTISVIGTAGMGAYQLTRVIRDEVHVATKAVETKIESEIKNLETKLETKVESEISKVGLEIKNINNKIDKIESQIYQVSETLGYLKASLNIPKK